MARQILNIGTAANDGTGDNLRLSQQKSDANFAELYAIIGSGYLPLDFGNLAVMAKGIQGGVPNANNAVVEINDIVFGRWSDILFIKYAVYNGPDPADIASYNVLESLDIP